jgi:hypothetical protein
MRSLVAFLFDFLRNLQRLPNNTIKNLKKTFNIDIEKQRFNLFEKRRFYDCRHYFLTKSFYNLFVYFGDIKTEVAFEVRGSKLDLINFYKFPTFSTLLQSSVDPPR